MFTIKEYIDSQCSCDKCELCARLGGSAREEDRVFVLDENGPIAAGVLGLERGKVIVKGVYGEIDSQYRDLMNRALLNACSLMNPITVRVKSEDSYWRMFGFKETCDGGMEIMNTDIKF